MNIQQATTYINTGAEVATDSVISQVANIGVSTQMLADGQQQLGGSVSIITTVDMLSDARLIANAFCDI